MKILRVMSTLHPYNDQVEFLRESEYVRGR